MEIVTLGKRFEKTRWPLEVVQSETEIPRRLDLHTEGRLKITKCDPESLPADTRPTQHCVPRGGRDPQIPSVPGASGLIAAELARLGGSFVSQADAQGGEDDPPPVGGASERDLPRGDQRAGRGISSRIQWI